MKRVRGCAWAVLAFMMLAGSGCVSYYTEAGSQNLVAPEYLGGPNYYTQYEVSPTKVKASGTSKVWFWLFTSGDPKYADIDYGSFWDCFWPSRYAVNRAKSAATYDACEKAKADHLLAATYRYVVTNYFFVSTVKCEVSGFPATGTGVKWVERKPILIEKNKEIIYVEPHEVVSDMTQPREERSCFLFPWWW